jgi:hypothetical protein
MLYKIGEPWQRGTFPILADTTRTSEISAAISDATATSEVITVTTWSAIPGRTYRLYMNDWSDTFVLDVETADANGFVHFIPQGFSQADAATCSARTCYLTFDVSDDDQYFEVIGVSI